MKNIILCILFLLVSVPVFAQTAGTNGRVPRQWDQAVSSVKLQSGGTDYTDNTTNPTNLVVTGNQATGNAGYLGLMAVDSYGIARTYYLWVDGSTSTGTLRMASFPAMTAYSSFPYGDWRGGSFGFVPGTKVSSQ